MNYDIGSILGDYQIVGILGAGGMGKVYKVRNTISDRIEAMKILLPNLDADQELAERFLREIKVQASLDHPNIAALRTAQRMGNQLVMIMEYIEGSTLEGIMRDGRIPIKDCVNYMSQVLSALAYAHARGIVHRDIKPANMMLTPNGVVKLMDFGIAKITVDHHLTQAGKTVGSLFYMSPEQIRGDANLDPRSDLYSLGISFYEMVTGRRPFEGESDYSIMAAHLQQAPQPPIHLDPSLPAGLNDVILIAISKDPAQRFQTADAFRGALKSIEADLGVGAALSPGGTQLYGKPSPTGSRTPPPPSPATPPSGRAATVIETAMPGMRPSQPQLQSMPLPPPPPQQMGSQPQMQSFNPPAPAPYQPQPMYQPPLQQAPYQQGMMNAPPPQAQSGGHRGLYMVLGSLVTIGILVGAAFYVPKMLKTQAGGNGSPTTGTGQNPSPTPAPQPTPGPTPVVVPPPSPQPSPAPTPDPQPQPQPVVKPSPITPQPQPQPQPAPVQPRPQPAPVVHPQPVQPDPQPAPAPVQPPSPHPSGGGMPQPGGAAPAPNPGNSELDELEHQRNLMTPRIEAINADLARLQQANNGGVNGTLIASQRRMQFYMETASEAIRRGNAAQARTALNNAERELGKLEEHFGR